MDKSLTAKDRAAPTTIEGPGAMAIVLAALVIFVAIVVWQMAFYYGSRQSNDLLLASPYAAEVIQLRAQLQEAHSYQTTLLSVVLASSAAAFTRCLS